MARQRLRGEAAPPQTVEQEALFAGVTKRRYQQVLQATREDLGLAPPNSGGRPPAAAVQEDAEALDLDRMLELQADTIEAQQRAAAGLAAQVMAAAVQQLAECRQLWPLSPYRRKNYSAPLRDNQAGTQQKPRKVRKPEPSKSKRRKAPTPDPLSLTTFVPRLPN